MSYTVSRSDRPTKKFVAVNNETGKRIYFGAFGYDDFTIHKDSTRRDRYVQRHQRNENWNSPETPGFWSRWMLWGDNSSVTKALADIRRKFKIKIKRDF